MSSKQSTAPRNDGQWLEELSALLEWLETQKGGVATFYEFQDRALGLRAGNMGHAALLRLLADLAGRFATDFDGEPLDLLTASGALEILNGYVRQAGQVDTSKPEDALDLLNRIGMAELASTK